MKMRYMGYKEVDWPVSLVLEGAIKTTTELSNDTKSLLDQTNQASVIIKRERQHEPILLMNRRVAQGALAAREFVNELSAIMECAGSWRGRR